MPRLRQGRERLAPRTRQFLARTSGASYFILPRARCFFERMQHFCHCPLPISFGKYGACAAMPPVRYLLGFKGGFNGGLTGTGSCPRKAEAGYLMFPHIYSFPPPSGDELLVDRPRANLTRGFILRSGGARATNGADQLSVFNKRNSPARSDDSI